MWYTIPGTPVPLYRPRYGQKKIWDAQKQTKLCTGISLKNQHNGQPIYAKPIRIEILFYFPIPKTKAQKVHPLDCHYFKPDIDNTTKFVLDVIKDVIIQDDCIIAELYAKKLYDIDPRTDFQIIEIAYEKE